jgi:hypothetical protein
MELTMQEWPVIKYLKSKDVKSSGIYENGGSREIQGCHSSDAKDIKSSSM